MRQRCEIHDRTITWSEANMRGECVTREISNDEDRLNQERVNEGEVESSEN